ncbi:hypothetical protein BGZ61DRAFT_523970 [Ilyonectria robusta]|uniref:uncharacterized protein n=1 Tax=Ilyonectria robusta TaxID=1079257 RepID=UPI001E8E6A1F|nr:uncharacterized protein BGZ61DRAFT_523970 [Ilyonectria robusta]KAH8656379.1 hypothetical protein BGZ61DRAFT_523970 [Ilyonectria robusta]
MAEAAGLGIGVAGLAGLVTSVRDAKERFDSYKNAEFESRPLLAQRDADRIMLQQWSESVGYGDKQLKDGHHSALMTQKCAKQSTRSSSASATLIPVQKSASRQQGRRGHAKGSVWLEKYHGSMSRKARLAWALQDKNKTSEQTQNVAALLQRLHDLVLPPETHGANYVQAGSETWELGTLPDLIQQLSMAVERALALDKEHRNNEFKREFPRWLGITSPTAMYDNFVQRRLEGICEWILQRREFQEWEKPELAHTKALWIHGPAGYGKTILCAKVIEHLRFTNSLVAYHFFSSDSESRADPFAIIRAWTYQMISGNEQAFELASVRWQASDRRPATPKDMKELFEAVMQSVPACVFIVDGLDECAGIGYDCKASYRQSLKEFFTFLKQSISKPSRLIVVSRDEPEIREGLHLREVGTRWALFDCPIGPKDVKTDAMRFARNIVNRKLQNKSELQRNELSSRVVDRFECMFLGIQILEGQLRSGKSLGSLHRTIDQAPTRLTNLYDRNWKRITDLPEPDRSRALAILRWATFASRPMTILEITEALFLADEGCETLSEDELPDAIDEDYIRSEILELCGLLVETRGPASEPAFLTVHLTHFSVKQYILCHELVPAGQLISNEQLRSRQEARENNFLAIACLRYLSFDQVWQETLAEGKTTMIRAFRKYAIASWYQHVKRDVDNAREAIDYVNAFFHTKNKNWECWRKQAETFFQDDMLRYQGEIQVGGRLFYAALLGFMETMIYLIDEAGLFMDHVDSSNRTTLLAASSTGWNSGVIYLIQNGASPNIPSNERRTPLYVASTKGRTEIVKFLLEEGADWTVTNNFGWTPLNSASDSGHLEVVKLLMEKGADLTTP